MPEMPTVEWIPTLPPLILLVAAIVVLVVGILTPRRWPLLSLLITVVAIGLAAQITKEWIPYRGNSTFNEFLQYDIFGRMGVMISLLAGLLVALTSLRTIEQNQLPAAEYYSLLLFGVFGMVVISLSQELITLFLGVEIVAFAIYILSGLERRSERSVEASFKYFILGAFSSAFLIFGIVFVYGGSGGQTLIDQIGVFTPGQTPAWQAGCFALGFGLVLAGLAFKLTLVPFHLYAADVYEGAPTPVAALLATGSKAAGFVALIHFLSPLNDSGTVLFEGLAPRLVNLLWLLAALSIIVGNVVAIVQRNIKRMLAYSSIAHSGYLLVGALVFVGSSGMAAQAQDALVVYLIAYVLMNVTAFGVAATLGRQGERNIEDYAGLARRQPFLALAMAVAMLALTGIPATLGFIGKFLVFATAVKAGYIVLVVIAVLGSVVSAYYYLRVIVYMYMHESPDNAEAVRFSFVQNLGLAMATLPIVVYGIMPQWLIRFLEAM